MPRGKRTAACLTLVAVTLSGCLGGDERDVVRELHAVGALVSDGYAYDGEGVESTQAVLEGRLNDASNTGLLNVSFVYGSSWEIAFDRFEGTNPWEDGGIEFELAREHGASGHGNAELPEIHAHVAAWGTGTVLRNGEPAQDPVTGATDGWTLHVMASRTTVRDTDRRIAAGDGSRPYDSAVPDDARTIPNDRQLLFLATAPSGPGSARSPYDIAAAFDFMGPETTYTVPLPTDAFAALDVNITVGGLEEQVGAGQLGIRFLDEAGNVESQSEDSVTPGAPPHVSWFTLRSLPGPLTLELTGQGLFHVDVKGTIVYDDHPFLFVTWHDFDIEGIDQR